MVLSWKYQNKIFRYLTEEKLPEVVDLLHNPETEKYLWFAPITLEGFRAHCLPLMKGQKEAFSKDEYPDSAVFTVCENGALLGICGLRKMSDGHNAAMIGYQLSPKVWGRGVGTCCAEFVLHYAKAYLKIRKMFGDCVTENAASARILEKCGFTFEGVIKEKYEFNGKLYDNSWYGLKMEDVVALPKGSVQEMT